MTPEQLKEEYDRLIFLLGTSVLSRINFLGNEIQRQRAQVKDQTQNGEQVKK